MWSYSAIWSLSLTSVEWKITVTSQPIKILTNFLTEWHWYRAWPSPNYVWFIQHWGYPTQGKWHVCIWYRVWPLLNYEWFSLSIEVTRPRVNGYLIWWSSHINTLFLERHWKALQNVDSYSPNWSISTYVIDVSPKSGHVVFHSDILTSFDSVVLLHHCFAGPLIGMSLWKVLAAGTYTMSGLWNTCYHI